jgi:hypothetical protein
MDTDFKKRPNISLSELYDMKKKKETNRTKCFDHIMELCHRRIRNIASYGGLNCFYEIPGILIGFPLYNLDECTNYLIEKLRNTGFLVQLLPPPHVSVVYISWDPLELKPRRPALMGSSSDHNSKRNRNTQPMMIDTDNGNRKIRNGGIHEVKMISSDIKPKITNPLKDRFRIF